MSEESQDNPVFCPNNPFGHSWKAVAVLDTQVQQRCRFCQQTREVRLSSLQQQRQRQAREVS